MSQLEVLRTLRDCITDPAVGLAAKVRVLATSPATSIAVDDVRTDYNIVAWKLSATMQPALAPNLMLRPGSASTQIKQANSRDAVVTVQVGIEFFDADPAVLQDNATLSATGLAQVLDGLRDYSDANGGTVIDVVDPIEFLFGEFNGPASSGFLASITIQERSRL